MLQALTKQKVKDVLDNAMGDFWGKEADEVIAQLKEQFPKHVKTIAQMEQKAVDAAQEREEPMNGEKYYDQKWWAVMGTINRLFQKR